MLAKSLTFTTKASVSSWALHLLNLGRGWKFRLLQASLYLWCVYLPRGLGRLKAMAGERVRLKGELILAWTSREIVYR